MHKNEAGRNRYPLILWTIINIAFAETAVAHISLVEDQSFISVYIEGSIDGMGPVFDADSIGAPPVVQQTDGMSASAALDIGEEGDGANGLTVSFDTWHHATGDEVLQTGGSSSSVDAAGTGTIFGNADNLTSLRYQNIGSLPGTLAVIGSIDLSGARTGSANTYAATGIDIWDSKRSVLVDFTFVESINGDADGTVPVSIRNIWIGQAESIWFDFSSTAFADSGSAGSAMANYDVTLTFTAVPLPVGFVLFGSVFPLLLGLPRVVRREQR